MLSARAGTVDPAEISINDRPGAEEVSTGSLTEMLTGLVDVAEELDLQIVVSTARFDEVTTALSADVIRTPPTGQTTLW